MVPAFTHPQAVAQVAKLSRQLEVLLAQHRQMRDAVGAHQRVGAQNAVLREQVCWVGAARLSGSLYCLLTYFSAPDTGVLFGSARHIHLAAGA